MQATAGYEIVLEVGVQRIREHSTCLTETLRRELAERGFQSPARPILRAAAARSRCAWRRMSTARRWILGTRSARHPGRPSPRGGLHVSPHFYTSWSELAAFAEALSELRATRKWTVHAQSNKAY